MQRSEFEIIQDLMNELKGQMEYSPEDLDERLGREKPKIEVMKLEAKDPLEDEDEMVDGMGDMEDEDPEEMLKRRLMKLRG